MKTQHRSSHAFSLIEAAIVLAIVGLVIGGIWVAASAVSFTRNISSVSSDLATIAQNIRSKGNSTFWVGPVVSSGSTTTYFQTTLYNMKLAPSSWVLDSTQTYIVDPYLGGFLDIQTGNGTNDSVRFILEYMSDTSGSVAFPRSTCIALVTSLMQKFRSNLPKRTTSPYSNVMIVYGLSGSTTQRSFDTSYDFATLSATCPADPFMISLFVSY